MKIEQKRKHKTFRMSDKISLYQANELFPNKLDDYLVHHIEIGYVLFNEYDDENECYNEYYFIAYSDYEDKYEDIK